MGTANFWRILGCSQHAGRTHDTQASKTWIKRENKSRGCDKKGGFIKAREELPKQPETAQNCCASPAQRLEMRCWQLGAAWWFFFPPQRSRQVSQPGEGRSTTHGQLSPGCFPALACPRTPGTSPRARSVLGMRALIKGSKGIGKKERHGKNRLLPDIKKGRQGRKTNPRSCHLSTGGKEKAQTGPAPPAPLHKRSQRKPLQQDTPLPARSTHAPCTSPSTSTPVGPRGTAPRPCHPLQGELGDVSPPWGQGSVLLVPAQLADAARCCTPGF